MTKKPVNFFLVLLLLLCVGYSGCSVSREREPDTDINSFRAWINTKASQLSEFTEEEWKNNRQDFKMMTNQLDRKQDELTEELKAEYRQLKQRFHELDASHSEQVILAGWRKELLGEYADMSKINTANVVSAYNHFMAGVREGHKDWSEQVWDMTDTVFEELNARKVALEPALSTEEEIEIKSLQMEYSSLELTE